MKTTMFCAAIALATATSPAMAQMGQPQAMGQSDHAMHGKAMDPTPTAGPAFVMKAGASDLYEIESSRLALTKSQNDSVRQFAQMMIDHHTLTTQQVTAAARTAGMNPPPPALEPMQAEMIAKLQPLSGRDFDRTYLTQQTKAHQMALALHTNYAKRGDTPALKQAASGAVPVVKRHYDQVRRMKAR